MPDIFHRINRHIQVYAEDMFTFTSELIQIQSLSGQEKEVAACIEEKMLLLGLEHVTKDAMGNVRASVGSGKKLICVDAHMDTIGVGDAEIWTRSPFSGAQDEEFIFGRGATDMKASIAAMVYAAKAVQDLDLAKDVTFMVCATVQEEPCEGLAWEYLIEYEGVRPDFVILAEPSEDHISIGQRGRMEIKISLHGKTAHASTPEVGDNALYSMAKIITELEELNKNLTVEDEDLGKGSLVVSEIESEAPSRNSVPEYCHISVDRRLTWGETPEQVLEEIRALPSVQAAKAEVSLYQFKEPSYTGLVPEKECSFPAWKLPKDHVAVKSLVKAYSSLFQAEPTLTTWPFSTNGSAIMGKHGIPVVGYGPGELEHCHIPNEFIKKEQIVKAAMLFASVCVTYAESLKS